MKHFDAKNNSRMFKPVVLLAAGLLAGVLAFASTAYAQEKDELSATKEAALQGMEKKLAAIDAKIKEYEQRLKNDKIEPAAAQQIMEAIRQLKDLKNLLVLTKNAVNDCKSKSCLEDKADVANNVQGSLDSVSAANDLGGGGVDGGGAGAGTTIVGGQSDRAPDAADPNDAKAPSYADASSMGSAPTGGNSSSMGLGGGSSNADPYNSEPGNNDQASAASGQGAQTGTGQSGNVPPAGSIE